MVPGIELIFLNFYDPFFLKHSIRVLFKKVNPLGDSSKIRPFRLQKGWFRDGPEMGYEKVDFGTQVKVYIIVT